MLTTEQQHIVDTVCCTTDDRIIAVNAVAGSGKGLTLDTKVLTPSGYKPIGNLQVGDTVYDQNGKETNIVGYYPQGFKDCYQVIFSNGNKTICDEDHLWVIQTIGLRARKKWKTVNTKELSHIPVRVKTVGTKGGSSRNNIFLPNNKPVEFKKRTLPIHPYVLGVLIGDGGLTQKSLTFTNSEIFMQEKVASLLPEELSLTVRKGKDRTPTCTIQNKIKDNKTTSYMQYIRSVGLDTKSINKHIPKEYLFSSIEDRIQLLRGLIDTDGWYAGSYYEYTTMSKQLAEDVSFLCNSLGLTVTSAEKTAFYRKNGVKTICGISNRLNIKASEIFPKLHSSVKHEKTWRKPQSYARVWVKSIKKLPSKHETVCIKVDSPTATFLIDKCTVTHNTSTGEAIIKAYKPSSGFYTAFNKAIVEDSKRRFGNLIEARTIHALAYKYIQPTKGIEDLNYLTIKEKISYEDKTIVINTLDNFFRSNSVDVYEYAHTYVTDTNLQELVVDYAHKMLEDKIPPTFNYLLKCLHIMLQNGEIEIDFDLFIFDEVQDVTAVSLEIFKLVNAKRKIIFGDKYQNIYSFMNTVNAFEKLDNLNLLKLTKSFRCNPHIAEIVETYGKQYLEHDFTYKGNENVKPENTSKIAYITRTNAMLIQRMYELLLKGQTFSLTRHVNDIFALPIALLNAANGRPVFDKRYKYLEKEYKNYIRSKDTSRSFYSYISEITEDGLLESVSKMLMAFNKKGINIYSLKDKVSSIRKPNPNLVLTTAHAFKGLEMDRVYIEDDLNSSISRITRRMGELMAALDIYNTPIIKGFLPNNQTEDLNTYYVALSRAKTAIMNVNYPKGG